MNKSLFSLLLLGCIPLSLVYSAPMTAIPESDIDGNTAAIDPIKSPSHPMDVDISAKAVLKIPNPSNGNHHTSPPPGGSQTDLPAYDDITIDSTPAASVSLEAPHSVETKQPEGPGDDWLGLYIAYCLWLWGNIFRFILHYVLPVVSFMVIFSIVMQLLGVLMSCVLACLGSNQAERQRLLGRQGMY